MNALERLASRHPASFGLLISLMVLAAYFVTAIPAEMVAADRAGYEWTEAAGRAAASLFFVYILWRCGWLAPSGVTRRGTLFAWILTLVLLAYDLVTTSYALFGSVIMMLAPSDPALSAAVGTNALMTGLIEEIPFRGIVLLAVLRAWGSSRWGVTKAVLYSSLLFGGIHVIHILLGRPIPQAILVAVSASLSGILYGALVLYGNSIWTVVVLHGVSNTIVAMRVLETPSFAETVPGLGLMILLQLPLLFLAAYLIYTIPAQPVLHEAKHAEAVTSST